LLAFHFLKVKIQPTCPCWGRAFSRQIDDRAVLRRASVHRHHSSVGNSATAAAVGNPRLTSSVRRAGTGRCGCVPSRPPHGTSAVRSIALIFGVAAGPAVCELHALRPLVPPAAVGVAVTIAAAATAAVVIVVVLAVAAVIVVGPTPWLAVAKVGLGQPSVKY
jgi:hypothetical protein